MDSVYCWERIVPFHCPSVRAHFKEEKQLFFLLLLFPLLLMLLPLSPPTLCCVIAHYTAMAPMVTLMWIIASGKSPLQLPQEPTHSLIPTHHLPTTTHHHKQITVNHWKMRVKHTAAVPQIMHCYKGCNCPLSAGLTQRMKRRRLKEMDKNSVIMQVDGSRSIVFAQRKTLLNS